MNSLSRFPRSPDPRTSSGVRQPEISPPIDIRYANRETSFSKNGSDRYAIAVYTTHPNITTYRFYYHSDICGLHVQPLATISQGQD